MCVYVYTHNSKTESLYVKGFADFHPKACGNLEVKCGYINKRCQL